MQIWNYTHWIYRQMDIQTFGQSYNGQKYTDIKPNGHTLTNLEQVR